MIPGKSDSVQRRLWIGAALALALLGLVLPPGRTAALVAGAASPLVGDVAVGLWWFKVLLLAHAALLLGLSRLRLDGGPHEPLVVERVGERGPASAAERGVLAALLVVGAGLRFYDLGNGLWHDEIQTLVSYARLPLPELLTTFGSQNQHMLYSLAAHVSFSVFGETAWALRLPAAVFGVASLGALYWFGTQVATRREALLATALATFSYHHVWFSQNARGYTSLLLWTLVGSGLFLRLVSARETRGWGVPLAYAAAMALALYTHLTAAFVLAAHGLVWVVLLLVTRTRPVGPGRWMPGLALLLAGTLTLLLYGPVLPQIFRAVLGPAVPGSVPHVGTEWQNPVWLVLETIRGLSRGVPGGLLAVGAGAAVGIAGLASYARSAPAATAVMLLPVALTAAAIIALGHNLWPRFFFFAAGFALLILVRGIFAVTAPLAKARALRLATAAAIVAVAASASTVPGAWNPKQDYLGASSYMQRVKQPGDAIVAVGMAGLAFDEYLALDWLQVNNEAELERIEQEHPRTWVLYAFPTRLSVTHPGVLERLRRLYRRAASFPGTIGEGEVVIMVRE